MKFRVLSIYDKAYITTNRNMYKLPIVKFDSMVPLYITLAGSNKMQYFRSGSYNQSGVVCKHTIHQGNYTVPRIVTYHMIYIDVVEHYKKLHDEASARGYYYIDVKAKDFQKISFQMKPSVAMNFPEQKYLQDTLPLMISDMIEEQMFVEKELANNNLELV